LEVNAAFRINDVRTTINGKLDQKAFSNRHKGLLSLSYATKFEKWQFDFTSQYNGKIRVPDTDYLPNEYKPYEKARAYVLLSAMITKRFKYWDIYVGGENLTGFKQEQAIIASEDPFGPYFDTTYLWGPIIGRTIYLGIRFSIK